MDNKSKNKNLIKRLIIAIIIIVTTIFVVIPFSVKLAFDTSASKILGTKVSAGSLSVNIFSRQINIKNIKIYQPNGFEKGIMAAIPFMQATLDPFPFHGSRLSINTLSMEIPQLVVIKNQQGMLNVNELKFKDYKTYIDVGEFIFSAESVIYIDYTAGPKPSVQGYQVNIYERRYKDLPSAEEIISKVLGDILARTAIKGAVVYGAASVAGVSLLGPLAIPAVAGIVLTEEDSAATVFHKGYDVVYRAARQAIKSMGELDHEDKDAGTINGRVNGADVTVSINKEDHREIAVNVSARRWLIPDKQTAAGVLYKISTAVK